MHATRFTLGVEEEYQLVDAETRELVAHTPDTVLEVGEQLGETVLQRELHRFQVEIATPVCSTLSEVRDMLTRARRTLDGAAEASGCRLAATATHPFSHWRDRRVTPKARYEALERDYGQLAREQMICGCHVHVGLPDMDYGIDVMNRARLWLAPLLALSANSPFWLGDDTGFASYRTQVWTRWPTAGPPPPFDTRGAYDAAVEALITSGCMEDATKLYWDLRLPERFDTIEFRMADVCLRVDEAVMLTGLVGALAERCFALARQEAPLPHVRQELVCAAHWQASRYGLDGLLVDFETQRPVPAAEQVRRLLAFCRPVLEEQGTWEEVSALVQETLRQGGGAARQRRAFEQSGSLKGVVDFVISETAGTQVPSR